MSRKKKITIILLILMFLYFLISYLFTDKPVTTAYMTEPVQIGEINKTVITTGVVGAEQLVSVGAQVSGEVKKLHVHLGQEIEKGSLIAEIDSTTQLNDLNTKKAQLDAYKAKLISARTSLKVAQIQYAREQKLIQNEATSAKSFENAQNEFASAKANVTELESLIRQTQISVSTAEANLSYTRIVAPLKGTVVSVLVKEGQTVNANQTTPNIAQIADLSQMEISMQISEGDITKIKPGMTTSYTILSEPDKVFYTTVKSVDPGPTSLTDGNYNGKTGTDNAIYFYGKLVVPNDKGELRIGMTTQNIITIAQVKNVLTVPAGAISDLFGKKFVKTLDQNGNIVEKEVNIGLSDNMRVQIISGLKAGELIISSPMGGLAPINGMSVGTMTAPALNVE